MRLAALSAFEFANVELGSEAYRLTVMSERGGTIRSSSGIRIETVPLTLAPDTLMVVGELLPRPLTPVLRTDIAEAGLLDGRTATTHWAHARDLQDRFPLIRVDDDRIFVTDGPIWTSAGMSAAIDLTLALMEDDHGVDLSRTTAAAPSRGQTSVSQAHRCLV